MVCQHCRKALRSCEGIKCGACDSNYHLKCTGDNMKNLELECGDRGFQWICATCQRPASNAKINAVEPDFLLNAINSLAEKFELVNKIQLPKLNNDLLQIKSVTERIVKQNEDILSKIKQLKTRIAEEQSRKERDHPKKHYRRRNLDLSPRMNRAEEKAPILGAENIVRYRTRRRSYPILKMLLQLNRKLNNGRTPRKNCH